MQGLSHSFQPILSVILAALDAPAVFMRTKALRALNQIVTSDPGILSAVSVLRAILHRKLMISQANVRRAIEAHLLDSSPAVRDVAVELIGKSVIESPDIAGDYYQQIADRIAVRDKRIIFLEAETFIYVPAGYGPRGPKTCHKTIQGFLCCC